MTPEEAIERVFLGEPLKHLGAAYREGLLSAAGLDPRDTPAAMFEFETGSFMKAVCRQLGESHPGDRRALVALRDWVREADDYEAWDALLTHYEFDGKAHLIRRGRVLFAGPMTAHWTDAAR